VATLNEAERIVVKIGSALLVDREKGELRYDWLRSLIADIADLRKQGKDVVIVSSGSVALGRGILGFGQGGLPLEQAQAAASVGQIKLARAYEEALGEHGILTGQVLVTLDDSADRKRYLNSRATMETLLSLGVTPIVNENDTIATDKIRYGDNDRLAAQVAMTVAADALVLLSDVDGLYTANPSLDPTATHIPTVEYVTPEILAIAGDAASIYSRGGMKTKVLAAQIATQAGCAMAITLGSVMNPLKALQDGARVTWFAAQTTPQAARKNWIASMKSIGVLTLDDGAVRALQDGRSLLPAGVTGVSGVFGRGDPVTLADQRGNALAYGLSRYTSDEANRIKGHKSAEISEILGFDGRAVLVHRDDMATHDQETQDE